MAAAVASAVAGTCGLGRSRPLQRGRLILACLWCWSFLLALLPAPAAATAFVSASSVEGAGRERRSLLAANARRPPVGVAPSSVGSVGGVDEEPEGDDRDAAPPKQKDRKLKDSQLRSIFSVSCLQAKQKDPDYPCTGFDEVTEFSLGRIGKKVREAPLNMGNFPTWRDERCRSEGAYLCDPQGLLRPSDRASLAVTLKRFEEQNLVTCGRLFEHMKGSDAEVDRRRFRLAAVVLGSDWPVEESDPSTLQKFGSNILAQWGLMPIYNGVDASNAIEHFFSRQDYTSNCPNAAVLIVAPLLGQAYLAAPSCEFICDKRGGNEIATKLVIELKSGSSLGEAIESGIADVSETLGVGASRPLSVQEAGLTYQHRLDKEQRQRVTRFLRSDTYYVGVQRLFLLGIFFATIFGLGAFIYFNCAQPRPLLKQVTRR